MVNENDEEEGEELLVEAESGEFLGAMQDEDISSYGEMREQRPRSKCNTYLCRFSDCLSACSKSKSECLAGCKKSVPISTPKPKPKPKPKNPKDCKGDKKCLVLLCHIKCGKNFKYADSRLGCYKGCEYLINEW